MVTFQVLVKWLLKQRSGWANKSWPQYHQPYPHVGSLLPGSRYRPEFADHPLPPPVLALEWKAQVLLWPPPPSSWGGGVALKCWSMSFCSNAITSLKTVSLSFFYRVDNLYVIRSWTRSFKDGCSDSLMDLLIKTIIASLSDNHCWGANRLCSIIPKPRHHCRPLIKL